MICQYAAFLARSLKVTSIKNDLGIISLFHKEFSLTNPLTYNWPLKSLLLGIKRVKRPVKGGEIAQKLPITPNILLGIYSKLNMSHNFDAFFWAICLVAVFGMFKKSHLLPTYYKAFDPNKQFSFQKITFFTWGALLHVRWSKTIQFRERVVQMPLPSIPSPLSVHAQLYPGLSPSPRIRLNLVRMPFLVGQKTPLLQCLHLGGT